MKGFRPWSLEKCRTKFGRTGRRRFLTESFTRFVFSKKFEDMNKKNLSLSVRRIPVREWTAPMYHQGKENYVDFYAFDPAVGRMRRKKVMVDRYRTKKAMNSYAKQLIGELTQKLMRGWSPWVESKSAAQFVPFDEVCGKYHQYVVKLNNDHAFRDETMRDYLSRLKVLQEWLAASRFMVYYTYQMDEFVILQFLDEMFVERNWSPQTYNNYVVWLKGFCRWLLERRYIHDDPTVAIKGVRKTSSKNRTVIPDAVLSGVREYLEERNKHFLLACNILHYMFIRPHEMSLLKIGDFHLERKTVVLHGEQTKNRQSAVITLPDHIVRLMVELDVFRHADSDYLFSDGFMPGRKWRDSKQFRDYWNRYVRKDLHMPKEYKFYSLKDTGITNMLRANTDPLSVRDQARHSSLLITNTYTPLDIKDANPLILRYRGVL